MSGFASVPVGAAWELFRDALLLGWLATAVFCATAGVAIAWWAGLRWWVGLLVGAVALYGGLLLLLLVGSARAGERWRAARAERVATTGGQLVVPVDPGGRAVRPLGSGTGARAALRRGWNGWTRTAPTRSELAVAVLAVLVAAAMIAATQVTWLKVTAAGRGVTGFGPFEIQLGLFVVASGVAALVCAVGVLRWRSAWWPVLLAWFGTWWLFVGVEVLHAEGALGALNRLVDDQVRERSGYDVRPAIALGVGWSVMVTLAVAMMVLAVVLLVLQRRPDPHYRPLARS